MYSYQSFKQSNPRAPVGNKARVFFPIWSIATIVRIQGEVGGRNVAK